MPTELPNQTLYPEGTLLIVPVTAIFFSRVPTNDPMTGAPWDMGQRAVERRMTLMKIGVLCVRMEASCCAVKSVPKSFTSLAMCQH